jgi:hypothetical protein
MTPAKLTRAQVYALIDGERDYQDSLGPDRREPVEVPHSTGEYLVMLDTYLRKAKDAWTNTAGDRAALDQIRKIAGIAVHCMEDNGAPPREV